MIKIARLPNPTFAVADLDSSGERLSRVPPRDTDAEHCPPALSKSAGPRSTGVEAMKMRAKYLILAIALLCLLALPSTALAADDNDGAKSRHERHDGPGRHRRRRGRSRHRVHRSQGRGGVVAGRRPRRCRDHGPSGLRRRRRVSDGGRDRRARRERLRRPDRRGQPGLRVRLRELARHHQPGDRPRQGRGARRRRPHGRRRRRRRPRQRRRHHLRPRQQPDHRLEGLRQQEEGRPTTTPVTARSSPA